MCHPVCTLHGAERLTHPLEPPCPKPQAPTSSNSSLASRRVETSNFPPPPAVPPFPFCISMVVVVGGKGGGQPPTTGLGLRGAPPFYLAIPPPPALPRGRTGRGVFVGSTPPLEHPLLLQWGGGNRGTPLCSSVASPWTGAGYRGAEGCLPLAGERRGCSLTRAGLGPAAVLGGGGGGGLCYGETPQESAGRRKGAVGREAPG